MEGRGLFEGHFSGTVAVKSGAGASAPARAH